MSGLSRMPFLGLAAARASGYCDDGSTQLYVRQYANCTLRLRERAHDIVRRAIRIADEAPLRARFTSPCDGGVRQSARLKTRQSQRRADLGPVIRRSIQDHRSGST